MKSKKNPKPDFDTLYPILIGAWRRLSKLSGPADKLQTREFRSVVEAVQAMKKGLESDNSLIGTDYFTRPGFLGAYLLYQWCIHYQEGLSLLGELPTTPGRVLDLASGPGAYAFAALHHGAREVIALDRSMEALQLGAEVCGRYGYPLTLKRHDLKKSTLPVEGSFDLIIAAHCIEELFPSTTKGWLQARKQWIEGLLSRLTPQGHLLLVDHSLPHANRPMLELRDLLVKENIPVQAPCVWRGECPALQSKSPCYAQRELEKPYVLKEIQRAAQINLSSLKMSYLILRRPDAGWPTTPEVPLYRVISPPIESRMGHRFYLCGTDGKKDLGSRLTEHPVESKAFEYLKRGELISVEAPLEKGSHFDITLGTRVKIVAALGKPYI